MGAQAATGGFEKEPVTKAAAAGGKPEEPPSSTASECTGGRSRQQGRDSNDNKTHNIIPPLLQVMHINGS